MSLKTGVRQTEVVSSFGGKSYVKKAKNKGIRIVLRKKLYIYLHKY